MSGLSGRPLQLTQTNPLLVFAYPLIDVARRHLRPHDAPARPCAYWSRNPLRAGLSLIKIDEHSLIDVRFTALSGLKSVMAEKSQKQTPAGFGLQREAN